MHGSNMPDDVEEKVLRMDEILFKAVLAIYSAKLVSDNLDYANQIATIIKDLILRVILGRN